jgi:hypothetical protein
MSEVAMREADPGSGAASASVGRSTSAGLFAALTAQLAVIAAMLSLTALMAFALKSYRSQHSYWAAISTEWQQWHTPSLFGPFEILVASLLAAGFLLSLFTAWLTMPLVQRFEPFSVAFTRSLRVVCKSLWLLGTLVCLTGVVMFLGFLEDHYVARMPPATVNWTCWAAGGSALFYVFHLGRIARRAAEACDRPELPAR